MCKGTYALQTCDMHILCAACLIIITAALYCIFILVLHICVYYVWVLTVVLYPMCIQYIVRVWGQNRVSLGTRIVLYMHKTQFSLYRRQLYSSVDALSFDVLQYCQWLYMHTVYIHMSLHINHYCPHMCALNSGVHYCTILYCTLLEYSIESSYNWLNSKARNVSAFQTNNLHQIITSTLQ